MNIVDVKVSDLLPYAKNPRKNDASVNAVAESIKAFGFKVPVVLDAQNEVIAGHTRLKAAKLLKMETVPCIVADDLSPDQVKAFRLADNKVGEKSEWDLQMLYDELEELKLTDIDMSLFDFETISVMDRLANSGYPLLSDDFIVPPFSVLNTRDGKWQERKRAWIEKGIKSEIGRGDNITYAKSLSLKGNNGTSVFDPVLCELMYKWFAQPGFKTIDPFAGGSVRGLIANAMGISYTGIELREEQVEANTNGASSFEDYDENVELKWICDDSLNIDKYAEDGTFDFLLACPPYADLEVYSDDPRDLSKMSSDDFDAMYAEIMKKAVGKIKPDRFAVVVIQDIRDKQGFYRRLTDQTINAVAERGFKLINEAVLIGQVGAAAVRARKNMQGRKLVKCHQNVLIFYNGDPKNIKNVFPEIKDVDQFKEEDGLEEYTDMP